MSEMSAFERELIADLAVVAGSPRVDALKRLRSAIDKTPQHTGLHARIGARASEGGWPRVMTFAPIVAAVLLTVLVIGTSVFLLTQPNVPPPAPAPAPALESTSPSESAAPTMGTSGTFLEWIAGAIAAPSIDGVTSFVNGVSAFSGGYVAVGVEQLADGGQRAAVWTSPDGSTWTAAPNQPAVEGGAMTQVAVSPDAVISIDEATSLATYGEVIVAIGSRAIDEPDVASVPAIWVSGDGTIWERNDEPVRGCNCPDEVQVQPSFTDITAVDFGLSGAFLATVMLPESGNAELMSSETGADWGRITTPEETVDLWPWSIGRIRFVPGRRESEVSTIEGQTFIVGSRSEDDGSEVPAIWVHGFGLQRGTFDGEGDGARVVDVAGASPSLVAIGTAGCCDFIALSSADDGETWRLLPGLGADEGSAATALVGAEGGGLVAFGTLGATAENPGPFAAWTSDDGASWALIPDAAPTDGGTSFEFADAIAASDGSLLVVGSAVGADGSRSPAVWIVR